MARGIIKLQEELHHRLLKLRSIEAIVRRPQFERLWADSTEDQQRQLKESIEKLDKVSIRKWMMEHPSLELVEKPLTELKKIAHRLGVSNYSRKGKLELVQDIQEKEKTYGTHQSVSA
jgi:hypothetical protein